MRRENEIKDFGERARASRAPPTSATDVDTVTGRHLTTRSSWINEAQPHLPALQVEHRADQPRPDRPRLPGRPAPRRRRHRAALRAEPALAAQRLHPLRRVERQPRRQGRRRAQPHEATTSPSSSGRNPVFRFRSNEGFAFPFEAQLRLRATPTSTPTTPSSASTSRTTGAPPQRLTINAGIRWDYETNQLNNDYVTPANVIAAARTVVRARQLLHRRQRPARLQGRVPAAARLLLRPAAATGKTVLFGGYRPLLRPRALQLRASTSGSACSSRCARSASRPTARRATATRRSSGTTAT